MLKLDIAQPNESFEYENEESLETFNSPMLTPVFVPITKERPQSVKKAMVTTPNIIEPKEEAVGEWHAQPSLRSRMLKKPDLNLEPSDSKPIEHQASSSCGKTTFCSLL